MLVHDTLTGTLQEIPDYRLDEPPGDQLYEAPDGQSVPYGEVVYDGLGNPVGLLPAIIGAALPAITSIAKAALPQVARIVGGLLPGGRAAVPSPAPPAPYPAPPWFQRPGQWPPAGQATRPVGWVTPTPPYTGMAPRRLYLRCSAWPGRAGLVPAHAAAGPGFPPTAAAQAAAAQAAAMGRRRRRYRFRRR